LCAGKTLSGCGLLRHGFVTSSAVTTEGLDPGVYRPLFLILLIFAGSAVWRRVRE
jgi:hypothetical protein